MSVHVKFETPNDMADSIYEMIKGVKEHGKIKRGSNEVTKAAERGVAKMIIMAEDVNPPELLAHLPLICDEKEIPYAYVPSQEYLASESGLPEGVKTASIALIEIGKGAEGAFNEIAKRVDKLRSGAA